MIISRHTDTGCLDSHPLPTAPLASTGLSTSSEFDCDLLTRLMNVPASPSPIHPQ